ncbi:hypothetical protein [Leifsonia sp. P73]|uniref:hypothetical protein n=1 Tax=Leifsonia sp. P73 TaxID=3423959 RepID=UPI003DA36FB2
MRVVEFSADAWQASAPGLQAGLADRMEAVSQLAEGLEQLAASGNITGHGADAMRAYIREVHIPILQCLLIGLTTFQTAVGVYWNGYAQVDTGGNFRLVKDEYDTHLTQLESGIGQLRGFAARLRQITADASHLVSLDGAGAKAAEQTADDLEGMHSIAKGQKETWEAYEASDPGFGQVQDLIAQLHSIMSNVGTLTVGRGRNYQAGSFTLTLQQLGELTTGMLEYCQDNQKAAATGWKTLLTQYAEDVDTAKREQAGWDLLWDGLQILAGAVITAIGAGLTPFTAGFSLGLTVLGGSLVIGGVNSAINHATIATTGNELNLIGMAAENVSHWYDANIATPAADSGVAGFQFLAGAGAALGDLVAGGLQVNVKEIGEGIYTLATDQSARSELWNQLTTTVGRVINGDAYATGYATTTIASMLIPAAAAAKFTKPGTLLTGAGKLPGASTAVKITTANTATSALDWIKDRVGAGSPTLARDFTPTVKSADNVIPMAATEALSAIRGVSVAGDKVLINGIEKMTIAEWDAVRSASMHNTSSPEVTLGKWEGSGSKNSYTNQAIKSGNQYFDLGENWPTIRAQNGLSEEDMFNLFNRPFLDDIIRDGKAVNFTHDPVGDLGALGDELNYLKKNGYVFDPEAMIARKKW